jgi:hypothetical protein
MPSIAIIKAHGVAAIPAAAVGIIVVVEISPVPVGRSGDGLAQQH